jgi:hypothetical protein
MFIGKIIIRFFEIMLAIINKSGIDRIDLPAEFGYT